MAKVCTCGCKGPVFSKGLCMSAWRREHGKPLARTAIKPKATPKIASAPRTKIKQVSKKRQKENKEYSALRDEFLLEFPECGAKLKGVCTGESTEVHHMSGRTGKLLLAVKFFLPICHNCHIWITENSAQAIEMKLSIRRNT